MPRFGRMRRAELLPRALGGLLGVFLVTACISSVKEGTSGSAPAVRAISPTERAIMPPAPSIEVGDPLPPLFHPQAVAFYDTQDGLITGSLSCPRRCGGGEVGVIARTTDAGRTWWVVQLAETSVTHVTIGKGTRQAWATVSRCHYTLARCGRALLHSRDRGETWTRKQTALLNPEFPTPSRGWASSGQARDLDRFAPWAVTTDGGRTWNLERGPCGGPTNTLVDMSFLTPSHGWVFCGASEAGAGAFQFKSVLLTIDGARTWEPVAELTLEKSDVGSGGLYANGMGVGLQFLSESRGWLWTGGGHWQLAETIDGGRTWRTIETDGGGGLRETVSMWWIDKLTGYWLRWNSASGWSLRYTSDGGEDWERRASWSRPQEQ
jgi:photosystem II stability/assembly factor-like uncharacterized protein